jgi:hypothetical protein
MRNARWELGVCQNAADFSEWVMPETGNCSAVDKLVQSPDKLAIDDIAEISLP